MRRWTRRYSSQRDEFYHARRKHASGRPPAWDGALTFGLNPNIKLVIAFLHRRDDNLEGQRKCHSCVTNLNETETDEAAPTIFLTHATPQTGVGEPDRFQRLAGQVR